MQRIASFSINHDKLEKGIYISRIDGDVVTYDVRMKKPNAGDYLSNGALHTLEHLLATYIRNSKWSQATVYIGPMGCRTGFYILMRDTVSRLDAVDVIKQALSFTAEFTGTIPGSSRQECGNYREHDLAGAKTAAADMLDILKEWSEEKMAYAQ